MKTGPERVRAIMQDTTEPTTRPESQHLRPPFELCAIVLPAPGHQHAIQDALHLLAAWAVRAARAQVTHEKPLDSSAPGSHECTPDRSTGEDGEHPSEENG